MDGHGHSLIQKHAVLLILAFLESGISLPGFLLTSHDDGERLVCLKM